MIFSSWAKVFRPLSLVYFVKNLYRYLKFLTNMATTTTVKLQHMYVDAYYTVNIFILIGTR